MSRTSRLEGAWRAYSADFQQFAPAYIQEQASHIDDPFVCPLCLTAFAPQSNLADIVSAEHIIPSALGGRLTTLTCRQCNNRDGSKIESHLVQRVRLETGKRHPIASLNFDGATLRAEMRLARSDDDVTEFSIIGKQSDDRREKDVRQSLTEEKWQGREINLEIEFGYCPNIAQVALVRSAYLFMFWRLGYRYVFNESALAIREQLNEPTKETSVIYGICRHENLELPARVLFAEATSPPDVRSSLAVFLRLDKDSGAVAQVILPPVNTDGATFYGRLQQHRYERRFSYMVDTKSLTYQLTRFPDDC